MGVCVRDPRKKRVRSRGIDSVLGESVLERGARALRRRRRYDARVLARLVAEWQDVASSGPRAAADG